VWRQPASLEAAHKKGAHKEESRDGVTRLKQKRPAKRLSQSGLQQSMPAYRDHKPGEKQAANAELFDPAEVSASINSQRLYRENNAVLEKRCKYHRRSTYSLIERISPSGFKRTGI